MKNNYFLNLFLVFIPFLFISCATEQTVEKPQILPPSELYGPLFYKVQQDANLFPDSKTFVDATPQYSVEKIREDYSNLKDTSDAAIRAFVNTHFKIPGDAAKYKTDSSSVNEHIKKLWEVLKRPADKQVSGTLIPLPNPYIIPGGRFREIYYWDSYFTMLGLQQDGQIKTIENMVDNFSYLIDKYGYIPNGNRTYYLGRSQPPFYAMMVKVLVESKGDSVYAHYLPYLEKEYNFWMEGAAQLTDAQSSHRRVVKMPDGEIMNRYWDDNNTPRPESYREDVKTAEKAVIEFPGTSKEDVYRNLRAAAESGWDFCSRWLDPEKDFELTTIHTTHIVPPDLNSLLYNLELTIAKAYKLQGNKGKAEDFTQKAEARKAALQKYLWNEEEGFYMDYNFKKRQQTKIISLAASYPLFFKIPTQKQADRVAAKLKESLLRPGGVVTTPNETGEQWDAPNGWAPLEWMTIKGLQNYNENDLASEITNRWLALNKKVYNNSYKMLEKYNVEDLSKKSGGGEYPTQDGFGWTNGVYQKLSEGK